MRDKIPMQELEPKCGGGGVIAGFYGTSPTTACYDDPLPDLNRTVQPMDSSYHYPLKWFQG